MTLRCLFSLIQMDIENARKVGMMGGWPNQSNAAGWRMHILSRAFAHCNVSRGCSVIRQLDSSPCSAAEKRSVAPAERRIEAGRIEGGGGYGIRLAPIIAFTWRWRCDGSIAGSVAR